MTIEEAKNIKNHFVKSQEKYSGYEIMDMWDMMCDRLYEQIPTLNKEDAIDFIKAMEITGTPITYKTLYYFIDQIYGGDKNER